MLPFRELTGMIGSGNLFALVYWSLNVHVCFGGHLIQSVQCYQIYREFVVFYSLLFILILLNVLCSN